MHIKDTDARSTSEQAVFLNPWRVSVPDAVNLTLNSLYFQSGLQVSESGCNSKKGAVPPIQTRLPVNFGWSRHVEASFAAALFFFSFPLPRPPLCITDCVMKGVREGKKRRGAMLSLIDTWFGNRWHTMIHGLLFPFFFPFSPSSGWVEERK